MEYKGFKVVAKSLLFRRLLGFHLLIELSRDCLKDSKRAGDANALHLLCELATLLVGVSVDRDDHGHGVVGYNQSTNKSGDMFAVFTDNGGVGVGDCQQSHAINMAFVDDCPLLCCCWLLLALCHGVFLSLFYFEGATLKTLIGLIIIAYNLLFVY